MKKEKESAQSSEENKVVSFMTKNANGLVGVREGGLHEMSSTVHPNSSSGSGHLIFTRQGGRQAQVVGTHPSVGT